MLDLMEPSVASDHPDSNRAPQIHRGARLKRVADVVISVLLLALVFPWCVPLVWCLQRAQCPGPLFFRQRRIGQSGRSFILWKFRTMHPGPLKERTFPAGAWLRRKGCDEFPQLFNVVCGQMSLIGPRPYLPEEHVVLCTANPDYIKRCAVRPGITGLAQACGLHLDRRGPLLYERRLFCDLHYVEHWSFRLDAWILARTAYILFGRTDHCSDSIPGVAGRGDSGSKSDQGCSEP